MSSITGCFTKPSPPPMSDMVPKDLAIYHSYGACNAEWGETEVNINAKGEGFYRSGRLGQWEFNKTFTLNETELLGLVDELEKSRFYSLNDSYYNPRVIDGDCSLISITKNNVTKSVSVSNIFAPEAYHKTSDLIDGIAKNKTQT